MENLNTINQISNKNKFYIYNQNNEPAFYIQVKNIDNKRRLFKHDLNGFFNPTLKFNDTLPYSLNTPLKCDLNSFKAILICDVIENTFLGNEILKNLNFNKDILILNIENQFENVIDYLKNLNNKFVFIATKKDYINALKLENKFNKNRILTKIIASNINSNDALNSAINDILEVVNNIDLENYIKSLKDNSILQPKNEKIFTLKEGQYLSAFNHVLIESLKNHKIVCIKGDPGIGKTFAIFDLIENHKKAVAFFPNTLLASSKIKEVLTKMLRKNDLILNQNDLNELLNDYEKTKGFKENDKNLPNYNHKNKKFLQAYDYIKQIQVLNESYGTNPLPNKNMYLSTVNNAKKVQDFFNKSIEKLEYIIVDEVHDADQSLFKGTVYFELFFFINEYKYKIKNALITSATLNYDFLNMILPIEILLNFKKENKGSININILTNKYKGLIFCFKNHSIDKCLKVYKNNLSSVIFFNDKELLREAYDKIKDIDPYINITLITADNKNDPSIINKIQNEYISKDKPFILLTTKMLSAGYSFLDLNVAFIDCYLKDVNDIKQSKERFRKIYDIEFNLYISKNVYENKDFKKHNDILSDTIKLFNDSKIKAKKLLNIAYNKNNEFIKSPLNLKELIAKKTAFIKFKDINKQVDLLVQLNSKNENDYYDTNKYNFNHNYEFNKLKNNDSGAMVQLYNYYNENNLNFDNEIKDIDIYDISLMQDSYNYYNEIIVNNYTLLKEVLLEQFNINEILLPLNEYERERNDKTLKPKLDLNDNKNILDTTVNHILKINEIDNKEFLENSKIKALMRACKKAIAYNLKDFLYVIYQNIDLNKTTCKEIENITYKHIVNIESIQDNQKNINSFLKEKLNYENKEWSSIKELKRDFYANYEYAFKDGIKADLELLNLKKFNDTLKMLGLELKEKKGKDKDRKDFRIYSLIEFTK